jgi:hypothetical protein
LLGIGMGLPKAMLFVAAMVAGMLIFEWIEKARTKRAGAMPSN